MFDELLESRSRRARNRAGVIASLLGHAGFITFAVLATRTTLTARSPEERVVPLPVFPSAPIRPTSQMPAARRSQASAAAPGSLTRFPVIDVPMPVHAPIDLGIQVPLDGKWDDRPPVPGRNAGGVPTASSLDGVAFAGGVDKPAMVIGGNPAPDYPDLLRRNRVMGQVTVEVVIDTAGTPRMETLRVVASDHPLFTDAAVVALKRSRFLPAEAAGRVVPMWVRQSFVFEIR